MVFTSYGLVFDNNPLYSCMVWNLNDMIFRFWTFLQHPAVSECCVLGLPHKEYGEIVGAIIVPEADVKRKRDEESKPALSLEELSSWAKDKLAPYKVWWHGHCLFVLLSVCSQWMFLWTFHFYIWSQFYRTYISEIFISFMNNL